MSNLDKKTTNPSMSLMMRRLGVFNANPKIDDPTLDSNDKVDTAIEGVYQQSVLLNRFGGHAQQERMIHDKQRSLDRALRYSYQGASVRSVDAEEGEEPQRALINPNKVKLDYDEKVISINWEAQYHPGTVFEWMGTNTYWLIMYQDLTELAYFRGDARKCHYIIKWADKETAEIFQTYASIVGPKEAVKANAKAGASIDEPNYTLSILIPKSENTLKYFQRYTKFYIQDYSGLDTPVSCWQVINADWISTPGVIQLTAKEEYINADVDDVGEIPEYKQILLEIEKKQQLEAESVAQGDAAIIGENFIFPKTEYTYTCEAPGNWSWSGLSTPITIISKDETSITFTWDKFFSGQFVLSKGSSTKTIVVQTLY